MEFSDNINFANQHLVAHYITFKFQELTNFRMFQISRYFLEFGFNSYQQSGRVKDPVKEPIFSNHLNKFENQNLPLRLYSCFN